MYPAMREHLGTATPQSNTTSPNTRNSRNCSSGSRGWNQVTSSGPRSSPRCGRPCRSRRRRRERPLPALAGGGAEDVLIDLRDKVEMAEQVAPTRPHPSAPHSELFHKIVGPGWAWSTVFGMPSRAG